MDNQTLYRSTVRLVSFADEPISTYSPQTISRAKKKLLAVASLHDNELQLNGLSYTKNDVISLLDSVTDETAWRHHCAIYAHPVLLAFLEEAFFDDKELSTVFYQTFLDDFLHFLSPWFAAAFNQVSGTFIRLNIIPIKAQVRTDPIPQPENQFQVMSETDEIDRFAVLSALMDYQRYIEPQYQFNAFERIRIYFHELIYTLKNLSWEKFHEDESVLYFVFNSSWMQFANKLPDAFATTRDEVAVQVLNIVLRFQRKATWYYLQQVCQGLQALECSENNKHEIDRLEGHFSKNVNIENGNGRSSSSSTSSGTPTWRTVLWIIWIVLTLVRMAGGCH